MIIKSIVPSLTDSEYNESSNKDNKKVYSQEIDEKSTLNKIVETFENPSMNYGVSSIEQKLDPARMDDKDIEIDSFDSDTSKDEILDHPRNLTIAPITLDSQSFTENCDICKDWNQSADLVQIDPCNHSFHKKCLQQDTYGDILMMKTEIIWPKPACTENINHRFLSFLYKKHHKIASIWDLSQRILILSSRNIILYWCQKCKVEYEREWSLEPECGECNSLIISVKYILSLTHVKVAQHRWCHSIDLRPAKLDIYNYFSDRYRNPKF